MPSVALELVGFFLGFLGMLGTLTATLLPAWKVSPYYGFSIVTAVSQKKGLWMECVFQSTGTFQCETYSSMLALPSDLQAARAMMVSSNVLSFLGVAAAALGMQCTICMEGTPVKTKVAGAAGCCFLLAGFFSLVPVSWVTHEVVQTFYQPNLEPTYKHELGECLYVGLTASLLSMLSGTILCLSCCDAPGAGPGGGYPYRGRAPGMSSRGMAFGAPKPQGGPQKHRGAHRGSSSSSDRASAPSPHPKATRYNTAAGYDITGYKHNGSEMPTPKASPGASWAKSTTPGSNKHQGG